MRIIDDSTKAIRDELLDRFGKKNGLKEREAYLAGWNAAIQAAAAIFDKRAEKHEKHAIWDETKLSQRPLNGPALSAGAARRDAAEIRAIPEPCAAPSPSSD